MALGNQRHGRSAKMRQPVRDWLITFCRAAPASTGHTFQAALLERFGLAASPDFARQLAALDQVYVNDAFGTVHRAHASTEGITQLVPGYAGFLMEQERGLTSAAFWSIPGAH